MKRMGRWRWSVRSGQVATGLGIGSRSAFESKQTSHPVRRHRTGSD